MAHGWLNYQVVVPWVGRAWHTGGSTIRVLLILLGGDLRLEKPPCVNPLPCVALCGTALQVEHHLWPQLSMLSYQRAQPLVAEICKKHQVPYIKHNVFWRLHKLAEIMVGTKSMRKYPVKFEHKPDLAQAFAKE